MKLNEIKDNPGARHTRILVGRGIGSGKGKTGGRGVKGQKARTGVSLKGFEGGQSPLIRRMPKRGFTSQRGSMTAVNLDTIQEALDSKKLSASKTIDAAALIEAGVIYCAGEGFKLLSGASPLKTKANFTVTKASESAIKAVEKAGGKVDILPPKVNKLLKEKKKAAK